MFFKKATSGNNLIWFYLATLLAVVIGYAVGQIPLTIVQLMKVKNDPTIGTEEVNKFLDTMDFSIIGLNSNIGFLLMILIFVFAMLAFMLAIKYFHKMPFKRLITPNYQIDFNKILFGFAFWFVLALLFESIAAYMHSDVYYWNFKPLNWIILLLICVFLLPIQTSFEELLFRGYMMPALSLITKNKWIPWVVTSVLFGLVHGMNPEVEKFGFWTMQMYYIGAGLFLGLITVLDDSLELALGVHAATNVFGAAFFSFDGSVLQTDSMIKASNISPILMSVTFLVSALIFMAVCNKRYKWGGIKRLTDKIGTSYAEV